MKNLLKKRQVIWGVALGVSCSIIMCANTTYSVADVAPITKIKYAFAITSDPQYPWTAKTDDGISQSDSDKERESRGLIRNQYDSINDYSTSIGNNVIKTIINGDITAYGHPWQWDQMHNLFKTLKMPYAFGLGNHDIENNFNDTFNNTAWNRSFSEMRNQNPSGMIEKDSWTESYFGVEKYAGSLDYSMKAGDFRIIMANNYPTMTASSHNVALERWLTPGMAFIRQQLMDAYNAGQPVMLFIHKPDGWNWGQDKEGHFKEMLESFYAMGTLRAVFVGHYHKNLGKYESAEHFGKVPVYYSGSASQKKYLTVEVNRLDNMMRIYKVEGNAWERKQLVDTIAVHPRR